jgi:hypothetical protein
MLSKLNSLTRHKLREYPHLRYWVKKTQKRWQDRNRVNQYREESLVSLEPDSLSNRAFIKKEIPVASNIEITNACNLNCLM